MLHINVTHDNYEHFVRDVKGWNVDFKQLSRGSFKSCLQQAGSENLLVTSAFFSTKLEQRGGAPSDRWTFAMLDPASPDIIWRGQTLSDQIAVYGPGSEIDAFSPPGFKALTISISEAKIDRWRQLYPSQEEETWPSSGEIVSIEKLALYQIQSIARRYIGALPASLPIKEIEESLISQLLNALLNAAPYSERLSRLNKFKTFKMLTSYIEEHLTEQIYLSDLCKATNTSPRTAQRLFRHFINDTPKRYVRSRRLNNVRNEIIKNSYDIQFISDVANKWGFWHLGQFALDYRKMFGELPSETLANATSLPSYPDHNILM